jgi:hypothetical protein
MADIDQTKLAAAKRGNQTAYSQLVRDHSKATIDAALAEMTDDDGKHPQEKNPFRKGAGFNLTEGMRLYRVDPALAARLAGAAGFTIDGKKIA